MIELDERREWLTEIWKQHHKEETERFGRCSHCQCRSLARNQRLWRTGMTRRDYISFLGENSWIWSTEPGWSMEPLLKDWPDSYEMGMGMTCVRCAQ